MGLTGPGSERDARAALGGAAVLTGGLAVVLRAARENVFVNRARR